MKKILVSILAVIIVSQSLVNIGVVVYYHLNKTYIAQKLCENRNNPKLHCNGHCYLSKQLKKAEEGEQKQTERILKEKEEIATNTIPKLVTNLPLIVNSITYSGYNFSPSLSGFHLLLLKPPIS